MLHRENQKRLLENHRVRAAHDEIVNVAQCVGWSVNCNCGTGQQISLGRLIGLQMLSRAMAHHGQARATTLVISALLMNTVHYRNLNSITILDAHRNELYLRIFLKPY